MILFGLIFATVSSVAWSGLASAHQLGSNNGVTVVLHVDPDDDPVSAANTQLVLYYGTTMPKTVFNTRYCDCHVQVFDGTKTIADIPVKTEFGNGTQATANVTFPTAAAYQVVVSGKASANQFPTFRVPFVVRVEAGAATSKARTAVLERISIAVVALIAAGVAILRWRRRNPTVLPASTPYKETL